MSHKNKCSRFSGLQGETTHRSSSPTPLRSDWPPRGGAVLCTAGTRTVNRTNSFSLSAKSVRTDRETTSCEQISQSQKLYLLLFLGDKVHTCCWFRCLCEDQSFSGAAHVTWCGSHGLSSPVQKVNTFNAHKGYGLYTV